MSSYADDGEDIFALVREVQGPECEDWGTKVQELCREFWKLFERDEHVSRQHVQALIEILSEEKAFELARLVIPDLRGESGTTDNEYKRQVIDSTRAMSAELTSTQTSTQSQYDDPSYQEEKETLADAELYRASLLLYNHGKLSAAQAKEVQEWLAARPGVSPK